MKFNRNEEVSREDQSSSEEEDRDNVVLYTVNLLELMQCIIL